MTQANALHSQAASAERPACFHCGLPIMEPGRYRATIEGRGQDVCCAGCAAVAETIAGSGLGAFYRDRERMPAPDAAPGLHERSAPGVHEIYDRPEVQLGFVTVAPDGTSEATLLLEGITCAACVWLNEQHLVRQPGVRAVDINYATGRARVRWDPVQTKLSALLAAVEAIGYRAWPDDDAARAAVEQRERRQALWRLMVAAFGMMQVMMYAYPAYIARAGDLTPDIALLLRLASLVLTAPVVLYSAAPFFRGALRDLRLRRLGMDVPVALGVGAGFLGSCWSTLTGGAQVYFDSVTMFVFFLLCGRFLERMVRERSARTLRQLMHGVPARATRLGTGANDGQSEIIPAALLAPGDRVLVAPGESFPADGVVQSGETRVDESLLTGESLPLPRCPGDEITGGAINLSQPVVVRVERAGADTRLAAIVRLVLRAQSSRPPLAVMADRVASWFVLAILAIAATAAIVWWTIDPGRAWPVAIAVLVVTCPCALSLATPAALSAATGAFARLGAVIARSGAIETFARITHVVFDKTGTLTEGRLTLLETKVLGTVDARRCRSLAAVLEQGSAHPVAMAIAAGVADRRKPVAPEHVPGAGIEAEVDGRRLRIGSRAFVAEWTGRALPVAADATRSEVWLAERAGPLAVFYLGDRVRTDAAAVVARLRAAGVSVLLASGDHAGPVAEVARQVGIEQWHAAMSPEDKQALIAGLQRRGARVAMVGDGVNDAPVLAQADCAIAMGSGAVLAQTASDFVITSPRLETVADAFELARRTLAIIRENLVWAFAYNVVAVPLAVFGLIAPWVAALGMSASSLIVVANALRLRNRTAPVPERAARPALSRAPA